MDKYYKNKKGIALPIVIIVFCVMMILGFSLLNTTNSEIKINKRDELSKKALQYAEAGYNAYLWHLNDDVNFYSIDPESDLLDEETKKLLKGEVIEFEDGYYQVKVQKPSDTDRYVTIISTGWTEQEPEIKRTVIAKMRKKQFVHHVYVSDSDGSNIWWTEGEECHGPYHTNGTLRVEKNPTFYDTVTYSNEDRLGGLEEKNIIGDRSEIYLAGEPEKVAKLEFPKSNAKLKDWAKRDGMVFQGRTCIYLYVENGRGKVKIKNGVSGEIQRFDIEKHIKHGVIYVEGNVKHEWENKFDFDAGNVFISGTLKGKLTIAAENIYITYDDPTNWKEPPQDYLDGYDSPEYGGIEYYGTKFNGKKDGTGIGSEKMSALDKEKEIYTRYAMPNGKLGADGKDMLGLVANYNVFILHYGWPAPKGQVAWLGKDVIWSDYNIYDWSYYKWVGYIKDYNRYNWVWRYDMAPKNITIHAAIFTVKKDEDSNTDKNGFGFEEYVSGTQKGDIILWGNVTQRKRRAIGATKYYNVRKHNFGYNKKYAHDPRMFYDYPPHILEPINVGWEVIEWRETNEHVEEKTEGVD